MSETKKKAYVETTVVGDATALPYSYAMLKNIEAERGAHG